MINLALCDGGLYFKLYSKYIYAILENTVFHIEFLKLTYLKIKHVKKQQRLTVIIPYYRCCLKYKKPMENKIIINFKNIIKKEVFS